MQMSSKRGRDQGLHAGVANIIGGEVQVEPRRCRDVARRGTPWSVSRL